MKIRNEHLLLSVHNLVVGKLTLSYLIIYFILISIRAIWKNQKIGQSTSNYITHYRSHYKHIPISKKQEQSLEESKFI